jgi:multidrug transporter EmrE-like cation transporter
MLLLLLILIIVVAESCAMYSAKQPAGYYVVISLLFYAVVVLLLRQTFTMEKMGVVNGIWSAASVVAAVAVGRYCYDEHLTGLEATAVALAAAAACLIGNR